MPFHKHRVDTAGEFVAGSDWAGGGLSFLLE